MYGYFYGELHLADVQDPPTNTRFMAIYIPKEIGNKQGILTIDWIALWN